MLNDGDIKVVDYGSVNDVFICGNKAFQIRRRLMLSKKSKFHSFDHKLREFTITITQNLLTKMWTEVNYYARINLSI